MYPAPETAQLGNGLRLFVISRPAGVVSLSVVVREGSGRLPLGQSGLAALTTHMLTEGTRAKSTTELAEAAEALGAELDSSTERDQASVSLTVLRTDLEAGLGLLGEVVRTPAFAAAELERVRAQWRDDLIAERQSPARTASLVGLRLLLGPALGAPVDGSLPDVERVRVEDLVAHYRRAFTPDEAAVVVVGDVRLADVEPLVNKVFGDWPKPARAEPRAEPRPAPLGAHRIVIVDRPGAAQSALFVAQRWPNRRAPGHEVREVLATVLGGMFTSRLNLNLREEHAYTYGVGAHAIATRQWGALVISSSVSTKHTAAAIDQILLELRAARDPGLGRPFSLEEIERAKAALASSVGARLESVDQVADDTAKLFSEGLPIDYYASYGVTMRAITRDLVAAEALERLSAEELLVVVVGARAKIEAKLRKRFAQVEIADPGLLQ
jgi:zinc protease